VQAQTPVALCSVPGLDASFTVDALARMNTGMALSSVALGSAEGYAEADKAIAAAARTGGWVMLKNVHLAPGWLGQLEKRLHTLKPHPAFRLFLTMEINPVVPASVLRLSRIFLYERAPGLRASLVESLSGISRERVERRPVERARLLFLVAWLHAVVQERLRYAPLGWTKVYEFNDADRRCAFDIVDAWVDAAAGPGGRTNLSPEKIPWDALRTLLAQSVYGGRVDNDFDQQTLQAFVNAIFTPRAYEANFELARLPAGSDGSAARVVYAPEGTSLADFMAWINELPARQSPAWLGLPPNAETVLLVAQGTWGDGYGLGSSIAWLTQGKGDCGAGRCVKATHCWPSCARWLSLRKTTPSERPWRAPRARPHPGISATARPPPPPRPSRLRCPRSRPGWLPPGPRRRNGSRCCPRYAALP